MRDPPFWKPPDPKFHPQSHILHSWVWFLILAKKQVATSRPVQKAILQQRPLLKIQEALFHTCVYRKIAELLQEMSQFG